MPKRSVSPCVLLVIYCFIASIAPMWILLQQLRGHLGGYFLYVVLFGGMMGLVVGNKPIELPAFRGWETVKGDTLFPVLFITIACVCSVFHWLIASGTTSKQLRKESDSRVIGYGAMLLEAMVAIVSLCCVMMLSVENELVQNPKPNFIYALGLGGFLEVIGVPAMFGISFGLMAFTTFVYDTLDVCTRLGRYILQELTGANGVVGRWIATGVTASVPLYFLLQQQTDAHGNIVATWLVFWNVFGASNQLLASLTLIGLSVWLWKTRRVWWDWLVLGIPTLWMYSMSMWALTRIVFANMEKTSNPVGTFPRSCWTGSISDGRSDMDSDPASQPPTSSPLVPVSDAVLGSS